MKEQGDAFDTARPRGVSFAKGDHIMPKINEDTDSSISSSVSEDEEPAELDNSRLQVI